MKILREGVHNALENEQLVKGRIQPRTKVFTSPEPRTPHATGDRHSLSLALPLEQMICLFLHKLGSLLSSEVSIEPADKSGLLLMFYTVSCKSHCRIWNKHTAKIVSQHGGKEITETSIYCALSTEV